jgi:hypothetical protein
MGARSTLEELNAWISLPFNFGFILFNNAIQRARKLDRGDILAVCTECIRTGTFYSKFPCPQRRW